MRKELPKTYEPSQYEDGIYKKWEELGLFRPMGDSLQADNLNNLPVAKNAKSYTISMPPPNRTGALHIGHAVMLAIEDILVRYHRMRGERTLWVPGTDHAAIATQTKVEKILKAEGTSRHKLGKEKFLARVRQFAQDSHDTIIEQVKKMGCSCDWSREAYTLDETRSKAARAVFKMMYDDGLIYRGERIVNWCPRCHSTLADDEVEYKEQKAKLYTFKYSKNFPFAIATTRPETKLGDTAVAVNPKDARYKKYIGRVFDVDFCGISLKIKIIGDRHVDMEFGTGALGVTPAHSQADWQMAEENNLDIIKVINENGKIRKDERLGGFAGMSVTTARKEIVKKLREQNLIEKEEEIENNLSLCYRCDTPVEPLSSLQWFINVNKPLNTKHETRNTKQVINWEGKSIKEIAIEVVKSGKIKIVPERFEKNYFHWMENLRDWCISRQIWFGHQVPVWYRKHETRNMKHETDNKEKVVELNFRVKEIFDEIKTGRKTVETRALNPEEPDKYFGDIKKGDEIFLNYKQGKYIADSLSAMVKSINIYKNDEDLLKNIDINKILPGRSNKDLIAFHKSIPGYMEKIKKNGIIAFELSGINECPENQDIYVGMEAPESGGWVQDEDTLDTWFSSGLWTFSTLANKPEQISIKNEKLHIDSDDFKNFHPTNVLETGYDILFFWVARMIIMTTYAVGDIPFQDVYLHGLVRDEKGRKMSKSLGNVIDPLDMIKKYGTDATRLSLVIGTTPGNDMNLSEEKIAGYRNMVNKLWNIARYATQNYELRITNDEFNESKFTSADYWILQKMFILIELVTEDLENYRFSQAGEKLREFTWNDLADWYLEASKFEKTEEKQKILSVIIIDLLKLWHPFIPFVTEVIWKELEYKNLLMISKWPNVRRYEKLDYKFHDFHLAKFIIEAIRNARAENKVEPGRKVKAVIYAGKHMELIKSQEVLIKNLRTGIKELEILKGGKKIAGAIYATAGDIEIYLLGAVDEKKEKERIKKEIANLEKIIAGAENKLNNKQFISKAPEQVVEKVNNNLKNWRKELKKLKK